MKILICKIFKVLAKNLEGADLFKIMEGPFIFKILKEWLEDLLRSCKDLLSFMQYLQELYKIL